MYVLTVVLLVCIGGVIYGQENNNNDNNTIPVSRSGSSNFIFHNNLP